MKKQLGATALVVATLFGMPCIAAEDTVESVEKTLVEAWDKLASMSGTLDLVADVVVNPNAKGPLHLVGGGSTAYMKKGDKPLYCVDAWAGMNAEFKMGQAKCIHDGKDTHLETVFMGRVSSQKLDTGGIAPGGKAFFDLLHQHVDLTLLPAGKINDQDVYILEGTAKEPSDDIPVVKGRAYLAKETGIPLKIVLVDKEGKDIATITHMDIKVNPPLSEGSFVYVPSAPPPPRAPAPLPKAPGETAASE